VRPPIETSCVAPLLPHRRRETQSAVLPGTRVSAAIVALCFIDSQSSVAGCIISISVSTNPHTLSARLQKVLDKARPILWPLIVLAVALAGIISAAVHDVDTLLRALDIVIWPSVALTLALVATSSRGVRLFGGLLQRVRRVSALGVEVELTSEAATRVNVELQEVFNSYRSAIRAEFDRQATTHNIPEITRNVIAEAVTRNIKIDQGHQRFEYRCTIYVPDILFHEGLYQLLDYYPGGSGRGRTFSLRSRMIGRTWRLAEARYEELPTQLRRDRKSLEELQGRSYEPTISTNAVLLIREWAMTIQEAETAGHGRKSFASVVLRHGANRVGLLYVDSPVEDAFEPGLLAEVELASERLGLTRALAELREEMSGRGPAIRIFEVA
jgi:hypothetical protein